MLQMNSHQFSTFLGTGCAHAEGPNVPPENSRTTRAGQDNRPTASRPSAKPARTRVASDRQLACVLSPLPIQQRAAQQIRSPDQAHRSLASGERPRPPSGARCRPSRLPEPSTEPSSSGSLFSPGWPSCPLPGFPQGQLREQTVAASGTYSVEDVEAAALTKLHGRPQETSLLNSLPLPGPLSSPVRWEGADYPRQGPAPLEKHLNGPCQRGQLAKRKGHKEAQGGL